MKRSGNIGVRFVYEHEVLVHTLGIDRSLENEQVLRYRSDNAPFRARNEIARPARALLLKAAYR